MAHKGWVASQAVHGRDLGVVDNPGDPESAWVMSQTLRLLEHVRVCYAAVLEDLPARGRDRRSDVNAAVKQAPAGQSRAEGA
jgi:hypothetical protein